MAIDQLWSLLEHSARGGSRSTALQPLVWLTIVTGGTLVCCLKFGAPPWLLVAVFSLIAIVTVIYLGSYLFLIRNNIDATRSEKFNLAKMELEQQSLIGDTGAGFSNRRVLGPPAIEPAIESVTVEGEGKGEVE